jgi:hypothetical protein
LHLPGVAEHCALEVQPLPPNAQVPFLTGHVPLAKHDAAGLQVPPPMPVQFAAEVHGVRLSSQTCWLQVPGVHWPTPRGHACWAPVLQ